MTSKLVPGSVVRVSCGTFDPARLVEVESMSRETAAYLVPAIRSLPGMLSYYAAVSPSGSMVHVSIWDSEAHAQQMSTLKEMIVDARKAALAVGVEFSPIVNYPVSWTV